MHVSLVAAALCLCLCAHGPTAASGYYVWPLRAQTQTRYEPGGNAIRVCHPQLFENYRTLACGTKKRRRRSADDDDQSQVPALVAVALRHRHRRLVDRLRPASLKEFRSLCCTYGCYLRDFQSYCLL